MKLPRFLEDAIFVETIRNDEGKIVERHYMKTEIYDVCITNSSGEIVYFPVKTYDTRSKRRKYHERLLKEKRILIQ